MVCYHEGFYPNKYYESQKKCTKGIELCLERSLLWTRGVMSNSRNNTKKTIRINADFIPFPVMQKDPGSIL